VSHLEEVAALRGGGVAPFVKCLLKGNRQNNASSKAETLALEKGSRVVPARATRAAETREGRRLVRRWCLLVGGGTSCEAG
jgi:hypothetical protein